MKFNLPVIVLKGTIILPEAEIKLEFEDEVSKNIIEESELFHDNNLLIVTQSGIDENIIINELPNIGTIAHITRKLELPNGKVRIVLKGVKRAQVLEYLNIGDDYTEIEVSAKSHDGSRDISDLVTQTITGDGTSISTIAPATYNITYKVNDNGKIMSAIRTIIVK